MSNKNERLYPLGYCQMNKIKLEPPLKVAEQCPLWQTLAIQYLEDASFDTVSMHFLDGDGITPADRIKPGMAVLVQDFKNEENVSFDAQVLANHGGLLHLQDVKDTSREEFIFYNHPRVAQSDCKAFKKVPRDILAKNSVTKLKLNKYEQVEFVDNDDGVVKSGQFLTEHNGLFQVKLDDNCIVHCPSFAFAPMGTFLTNSPVKTRKSNPKDKFPVLLSAQDLGFQAGQKCAVLLNKNEFHPCEILETRSHFLKLRIETLTRRDFITSVHNPILFPLSWSQNHGLPFFILAKMRLNLVKIQENQEKETNVEIPKMAEPKQKEKQTAETEDSGSWCPPIFFNYKCYSASFLSRARLAGLPKKVGPGPVQLVLREVLNLIIGSSFKSGSVLKRLEVKRDEISKDFVIEELKGKSRVLNLKAKIQIPTKVYQVDKYLSSICQKLSACPNLVSTKVYKDVCPMDCHKRPKTDFKEDDLHLHDIKSLTDQQQSRPVARQRRGGKKRRHPDRLLVENSKISSDDSETSSSRPSSPSRPGLARKKRSKEWNQILPKSEIRTRGAKIPNFSLHMKIRPSRKEQRAIENSSRLKANVSYSDNLLSKSGGKKGRRELPPAFNMQDFPKAPPPIRRLKLKDNPEHWSPQDTARFLSATQDCAHLSRFVIEDDIDGPAFMLLNYPTVKEYWKLKTNTAISLCRHIESVVLAHRSRYYY